MPDAWDDREAHMTPAAQVFAEALGGRLLAPRTPEGSPGAYGPSPGLPGRYVATGGLSRRQSEGVARGWSALAPSGGHEKS